MKPATGNATKTWAIISLAVLFLSIALQFIALFQTQYQLVSPLIPKSITNIIREPIIIIGLVTSVAAIAGMLLYFSKKYLLVIILAVLTIAWQQFYPY